jgi:hypothetical protein
MSKIQMPGSLATRLSTSENTLIKLSVELLDVIQPDDPGYYILVDTLLELLKNFPIEFGEIRVAMDRKGIIY